MHQYYKCIIYKIFYWPKWVNLTRIFWEEKNLSFLSNFNFSTNEEIQNPTKSLLGESKQIDSSYRCVRPSGGGDRNDGGLNPGHWDFA